MPQLDTPGASMWTYPVYVHNRDRRAARRVLAEARDDFEAANQGRALKGALIVVGGSFAIGLLLILLNR